MAAVRLCPSCLHELSSHHKDSCSRVMLPSELQVQMKQLKHRPSGIQAALYTCQLEHTSPDMLPCRCHANSSSTDAQQSSAAPGSLISRTKPSAGTGAVSCVQQNISETRAPGFSSRASLDCPAGSGQVCGRISAHT